MKNFFKLKIILIFSSIFSHSFCFAASEGVPVFFIFSQALNFTIFVLLLSYLVVKKVPSTLKTQYQDYMANKKRAKEVYQKALKTYEETKIKMESLKKRETLYQEEIKLEAKKLENLMASELRAQKEALRRSAENIVYLEKMGLKEKLKEEYLNQVISLCKKQTQAHPYNMDSLATQISEKKLSFKKAGL